MSIKGPKGVGNKSAISQINIKGSDCKASLLMMAVKVTAFEGLRAMVEESISKRTSSVLPYIVRNGRFNFDSDNPVTGADYFGLIKVMPHPLKPNKALVIVNYRSPKNKVLPSIAEIFGRFYILFAKSRATQVALHYTQDNVDDINDTNWQKASQPLSADEETEQNYFSAISEILSLK